MSNHHRPWTIVATFPGHKPKQIGRVRNRADADAHVRFLQHHVPQGAFCVVFDPEEDAEMAWNGDEKLEKLNNSGVSNVDFADCDRN